MKKDNGRKWFTLDELIGTLNSSLETANQRIMNGESETPFSVSEFSVELAVFSQGERTNGNERTVRFSFPTEEELLENSTRATSRISIHLKPTLTIER